MSSRITGFVDYGNGAGPKKAEPLKAPPTDVGSATRPIKPHIAGQRRPAVTDDEMYEYLLGYARRRERAPITDEIATRVGHAGDRVLRRLVRNGRVVIEIGMRNYRVFVFVGTEFETLRPKGFRAHRRINTAGEWWKTADGWKLKQYGRSNAR